MCETCGCGQPGNEVRILKPGDEAKDHNHHHDHAHHDHDHDHHHSHDHDHDHDHHHHVPVKVQVEEDILGRNNLLAQRNRGYFEAKNIDVYNLVSSPGSGKTCLLERTIREMGNDLSFFIIEGDQQTLNDAERIKNAGAPVIQVNTGHGCHLDAEMVNNAMKELELTDHSILMIENVGNLVCPALFDLGESKRVVIMSVTEGDDKPQKYPYMFQTSDLCIINKIDLLPYVDFNPEKAKEYALQVNHHLTFIELSAKTGEGMDLWYDWLRS
jgi:hydrogenase nickel incorporation protein HypB